MLSAVDRDELNPLALFGVLDHQGRCGALAPLLALIVLMISGCRHTAPAAAASDPMVAADRPAPVRWSDEAITLANLGHATLMMNFLGVRIISDPSLFSRVGLAVDSIFTIGPRRQTPPPLEPSQLGPIDVILITHAHMDHLDIPSLEALPRTATVIACAGCGALIRPLGFADVRELRWGQRTSIKNLSITAMGARHWGRRWPFGRVYGFNSYVLAKNGHRMLLACDSAFTDMFSPLHRDPLDIAAFSIGAYDPWIFSHADPEQVWAMFQQTGARWLVPIHWGTFKLSKEPRDEPMRRLIAAAGAQAWRIEPRQIGATWREPPAHPELTAAP